MRRPPLYLSVKINENLKNCPQKGFQQFQWNVYSPGLIILESKDIQIEMIFYFNHVFIIIRHSIKYFDLEVKIIADWIEWMIREVYTHPKCKNNNSNNSKQIK